LTLTVGDGFKFGCGAILAVAFAVAVAVLCAAVALLIANLMGVRPPVPGYSV
jgi:hypothetical protein